TDGSSRRTCGSRECRCTTATCTTWTPGRPTPTRSPSSITISRCSCSRGLLPPRRSGSRRRGCRLPVSSAPCPGLWSPLTISPPGARWTTAATTTPGAPPSGAGSLEPPSVGGTSRASVSSGGLGAARAAGPTGARRATGGTSLRGCAIRAALEARRREGAARSRPGGELHETAGDRIVIAARQVRAGLAPVAPDPLHQELPQGLADEGREHDERVRVVGVPHEGDLSYPGEATGAPRSPLFEGDVQAPRERSPDACVLVDAADLAAGRVHLGSRARGEVEHEPLHGVQVGAEAVHAGGLQAVQLGDAQGRALHSEEAHPPAGQILDVPLDASDERVVGAEDLRPGAPALRARRGGAGAREQRAAFQAQAL